MDAGDRAQLPDERRRAGSAIPHAGRGAGPRAGAHRVRSGSLDGHNLDRDPGGPGCRVRGGDPLAGCEWVGELFERLFAPWVLRRLYADELERLDRYVRTTPPD